MPVSAVRLRIQGAVLALMLAVGPLLVGQAPPQTGLAPLPAQILTARSVFLSNAGADGNAFDILKRVEDPRPNSFLKYVSAPSFPTAARRVVTNRC